MNGCFACGAFPQYRCSWIGIDPRTFAKTRCNNVACYRHVREPAEGMAYCSEHWAQIGAEKLPYVPDYLARAADQDPEAYNSRRPRRKVAR